MMKTHTFYWVNNEHFRNLNLSNQTVQNILFESFDLLEWFLAKVSWKSQKSTSTKFFKFKIKESNSFKLVYHIQTQHEYKQLSQKTTLENVGHHSQITHKKNRFRQLFIYEEVNRIKNTKCYQFYSSEQPFSQISQKYPLYSLNKQNLVKQHKGIQIGQVQVQVASKIHSVDSLIHSPEVQRNHVQLKLVENVKEKNVHSLFWLLCDVFGSDYRREFAKCKLLMKPISASSYICLQQGNVIPYLTTSKTSLQQKSQGWEFIFRKIHRMTNKKQYNDIVLNYAKSVQQKTKLSQTKNQMNKYNKTNNETVQNGTNPISNHFICTLSNVFVPFVLSLGNLLTLEQQRYFLIKYVQTIFPSYNENFSIKKGASIVQLPDKKFKQIKKAINFIINKVILQYSNEITSLASQLSFVFGIAELLNESLLTKDLIDQLLLLLSHYGGVYPEILLKADEWVNELNESVSSSDKKKSGYELNKIISPGILTRFRQKIQPLLDEVLLKSGICNEDLNFENHLKWTSNAFTVTAFDINSHTVRFFNYLTTPKMSLIDFLVLKQNFQCIQLKNEWTPYKIIYEHQTILVNLQKHALTAPLSIQYLEQYTDNPQIRKTYFNFSSVSNDSQCQKRAYKKLTMEGKIKSDSIYEQRLTQFRMKRHQIMSQIKRLLFSNIPKTKLIWRFIKHETSSNRDKENAQSDSTITVLRKIELVNHLYNLLKTMMLHEKNVSRQVWLESQCNLLDQVHITRKNFIQEGEEDKLLNWEIQRVSYLKLIVEEQISQKDEQNKEKLGRSADNKKGKVVESFSTSVKLNIFDRLQQSKLSGDVLSESQKFHVLQEIIQKLQNLHRKIKNFKQKDNEIFLSKVEGIIEQKLNFIKQSFSQNQLSLNISLIGKQMNQKLESLELSDEMTSKKTFNQIKIEQISLLIKPINDYIKLLKSYQNKNIRQQNESNLAWFKIQVVFNKMVENFILQTKQSIMLNSNDLVFKIYFDCGVKQLRTYDIFLSNLSYIQKKINQKVLQGKIQTICGVKMMKFKINLVMDSKENSELYCSLYLRLIFGKIQKIEEQSEEQIDSHYQCESIEIKPQQIMGDCNYQVEKSRKYFSLQRYFQSFTCSGFQSIAILEIILFNNFSSILIQNSQQNIKEILLKLPVYKHLLSWTNFQEIDSLFDDFNWHLIEQKQAEKFYQLIYTPEYQNQLKVKSQVSKNKLDQLRNLFRLKSNVSQSSTSSSKFHRQRKKVESFLVQEILEEWIQILKRKSNPSKYPEAEKVTLENIVQKKIFYNNKVLETYSILEKKQVITVLKKYIQKFGIFIEEILSISIDSIPHSSNQWKSILLKNALSGYKLKMYIKELLLSYNLDFNITFQDLNVLGKDRDRFQGLFSIVLWNCRKQSIEVCNCITKPKMPIWFAIYSACSLPFYIKQQISHHKWQGGQRSVMFSSFHQFPQTRNSLLQSYDNLFRESKEISFKRTDSVMIQEESRRQSIEKSEHSKGGKIHRAWVTPPLIDQQTNKYLNPNLLESFPLIYLTNPHVGMIKNSSTQSANVITICFQKIDGGFRERIKTTFFEQKQMNFNISSMFGLFFNKKDKNIMVLRQYIRKVLKQTHFYSFFQTTFQGNKNLYKNHSKIHASNLNFDISEQTRKVSDDFTSQTPNENQNQTMQEKAVFSQGQDSQNENESFPQKSNKIIISKLSVQCIDEYGDIIHPNQNKFDGQYKFYPTFQQSKNRIKKQEPPMMSSNQLLVDFQSNLNNQQSLTDKKKNKRKSHKDEETGAKQEISNKNSNIFKRMFVRYFLNCTCLETSAIKGSKIKDKKSTKSKIRLDEGG